MIFIISHYYVPVQNAPANRISHLVKSLKKNYPNEPICVVTGRPNHPKGLLPTHLKWKLFNKFIGRYGETVVNLYEIPASNKGFLKKSIGYFSFSISVFIYLFFLRLKKDDIVFVTTPPVFSAYAVTILTYFKKFKFILDVRDLWPESISALGLLKEKTLLYSFFFNMSKRMYKRALKIIAVTGDMVNYISYFKSKKDIVHIHNMVDVNQFSTLSRSVVSDFKRINGSVFNKKTVFLYSGVFAEYIDLRNLLHAVKLVVKQTRSFTFMCIGHGEEELWLKTFVKENSLDDIVRFYPYMSRTELHKFICAADYCYFSLTDNKIFKTVIPTKTMEYLACDKLLLGAIAGTYAKNLTENKLAYIAPPGDIVKLSDIILTLINNKPAPKKNRARQYAIDNFSYEKFSQRFTVFFAEFLNRQ